jgi:hypothetical protein
VLSIGTTITSGKVRCVISLRGTRSQKQTRLMNRLAAVVCALVLLSSCGRTRGNVWVVEAKTYSRLNSELERLGVGVESASVVCVGPSGSDRRSRASAVLKAVIPVEQMTVLDRKLDQGEQAGIIQGWKVVNLPSFDSTEPIATESKYLNVTVKKRRIELFAGGLCERASK